MRKARIFNGVKEVVPILGWLPHYNTETALGDLIAGITVGLTLIPQSIAYAALAGLEPQYGLYSSLCGGFIYACFGTVKDLNIAPTALISLLTYSYIKDTSSPEVAIFLCFSAGLLQFLFGVFKLGFLVDFVSAPVVSGFTSAGAITIAASQVKSMLGLKFRAESFIEVVYHVFANITKAKLGDTALSLVCCVLLIGLREVRRWGLAPSVPNASRNKIAIWFISVGRNALIVITTSVCAYFLHSDVFTLTNTVPDGLPQFAPPFKLADVGEHVRQLYTGILVVALVAILSNMAIAKSFSSGKVLNASQEMSTLGLCNIVGSFFGSFPVNASFSRAALNHASGARTTFGGIYTGIMVILSLTFLTKYFIFIPKAALASVIFCAVIYMVEIEIVKNLWQTTRIELIPLAATFLWSLADSIERGILVGVVVDLLLIVWFISKPKIKDEIVVMDHISYLQLALVGSLTYISGESVREKTHRVVKKCHNVTVTDSGPNANNPEIKCLLIVFDCNKLQRVDYSATKALGALMADFVETNRNSKEKVEIVFLDLNEKLRIKMESIIGNTLNCVNKDNLHDVVQRYTNTSISPGFETTPC
ncbi:sodium-independent sulfate anion transporter-like [Atheta coriaria]|uniref:sodium-independent sulfate anion transporter-like n=1 Tax=Dalotia coriaria TaxID=877792 RepID=UPI0031F38B29